MQNIKKIGFQLKFVRQRFFIKLSIRFPLEVFLTDHRIFVAELNFSMMKKKSGVKLLSNFFGESIAAFLYDSVKSR